MSGQLDDAAADDIAVTRHRCAVCNARKVVQDFPQHAEGHHVLVTCRDCAGNAIPLSRGRRAHANASADAVQPTQAPRATTSRKRKRGSKEDYPLTRKKKARSGTNPKTPRQPRPKIAICRICIEEKPIEDFVKSPPKPKSNVPWWRAPPGDVPARCLDHLTVNNRQNKAGPVCRTCIGATLVASIDLKGPERLGCPDENCNMIWDSTDYVAKFLSNEEFAAYSEKLFETWSRTNRQLKQCINAECGKIALIETNTAGFPHVSWLPSFCAPMLIVIRSNVYTARCTTACHARPNGTPGRPAVNIAGQMLTMRSRRRS